MIDRRPAMVVRCLGNASLETIIEHAARVQSPYSAVTVFQMEGALNALDPEARRDQGSMGSHNVFRTNRNVAPTSRA